MQKNSKAAIFNEANKKLIFESIEIPDLKNGEILVSIECTSLCRSDLNTFSGKRTEKIPTILGHEIVGKIVSMNNNSEMFDLRGDLLSVGDRITWGIYSSNPESKLSKKGIPQKADELIKYGHEKLDLDNTLHGGLSEFIILRKNTPIIKIRNNVPLKIISIINCSVATVAGALRIAGELKGKNVLISGAGMLGIVACGFAKYLGADKIITTDISDKRLMISLAFGSDYIFNASNGLTNLKNEINFSEDIDVVIEFSGVASAMEETLDLLSIGGIAVWIGATFPQRNLEINPEKIIRNIHTIKGLHNYNSEDLILATKFIEENFDILPFDRIVLDQFSLETVNEAFEYAINKNPFRVAIYINQEDKK